MKLLSTSPKIEKSNNVGSEYYSTAQYLAPHKLSGYNTCTDASPECIKLCLNFSGHAQIFPKIHECRIERTKFFFENRTEYFAQLRTELDAFVRKCDKLELKPCVRLNATSDILWEKQDKTLFSDYPMIQYNEYTKHYKRYLSFLDGKLPPNLYLTFSRSEINELQCRNVLLAGGNVAQVYRYKNFPDTVMGYPVCEGDSHDMRFLDPKNHIIALSAKGSRAKRSETNGFVIQNQPVKKSSKKLVLV